MTIRLARFLRLPHKMHLASPKTCKVCKAFAKSETIRSDRVLHLPQKKAGRSKNCTLREAFHKTETIRLTASCTCPKKKLAGPKHCSLDMRDRVREVLCRCFPVEVDAQARPSKDTMHFSWQAQDAVNLMLSVL